MSSIEEFAHLRVPLEAIKLATNNFGESSYVSRGGFGKVYKGELFHLGENVMIAAKRLDTRFGQGTPEFWKEIMMLSRYRHENLVTLIGFCDEGGENILVYEYLPNLSLDMYLSSSHLLWIQRLNICIGAACGLESLHDPGTIGYCDPLYVDTGLLTKESDVYSFGVVLFEVLCGRLSIANYDDNRRFLSKLAQSCYEENKMQTIVLDCLKEQIHPKCLEIFSKLAYQCLQRDRKERPLVADIVKQLKDALECQVEYMVEKENNKFNSKVKLHMSEKELKAYDGSDPMKPVLMAIKGQIYDVSSSRMFYGAGGIYGEWSGKDASRAIAKLSFQQEDMNGDLTGLGKDELEVLQNWEIMFKSKYVKVGSIKKLKKNMPGWMYQIFKEKSAWYRSQ